MKRFLFGQNVVSIPKKKFKDEPSAQSFEVKIKGQLFQGLVVRKDGKYFAFRNLCMHLPVTLDLRDDQFFTHDKTSLQCHMHGAIYDIESGECTAGPCQGAKLVSLPLREEEKRVVVTIPTESIDK